MESAAPNAIRSKLDRIINYGGGIPFSVAVSVTGIAIGVGIGVMVASGVRKLRSAGTMAAARSSPPLGDGVELSDRDLDPQMSMGSITSMDPLLAREQSPLHADVEIAREQSPVAPAGTGAEFLGDLSPNVDGI